MFRDIWKNYHRYFKVSNKESNLAILLGIFGAFLETFSIYLLANIITSLGYKNTEFNVFSDYMVCLGIAKLIYFPNKDEIKSFTQEKKGFFNKFYSLFLK